MMDVIEIGFRPIRLNGNGQRHFCNGCGKPIERGSDIYFGQKGQVYHPLVDCVLSSGSDTMTTVAEGKYV
jgi:hypothetical protein